MKNIFLISPVRNITSEQKQKIDEYTQQLETEGNKVYIPYKHTNQNDPRGLRICNDNFAAINKADEIHIWHSPDSTGSLFDLGMAFALRKKLIIANSNEVEEQPIKHFNNVIVDWSKTVL